MDSERIAEIKNDRGEYPQVILYRARGELMDKALDGLTFDAVLAALAEMPGNNKDELVSQLKFRTLKGQELFSAIIYLYVDKYLEPSETEIQQRADEILVELDYAKGKDI